MQDEADYREPWDQAGAAAGASVAAADVKSFHFREAGVQRFNDIYDWDEDDR